MKETAILLNDFSRIGFFDLMLITAGWFLGNAVFNNFEKHLPYYRRLGKFTITMMIFYISGIFLGRPFFYGLLIIVTIGQIILHAWYFPKHGINGLTAEPYEKYLELIHAMKRRKF